MLAVIITGSNNCYYYYQHYREIVKPRFQVWYNSFSSLCSGIHSVTLIPLFMTPKRLQWFQGHVQTNHIQKRKRG